MKVVILAGGFGTRLSEETVRKPKPMVEIGTEPILWHIMNLYAAHGHKEFVIALGYMGHVIKDYFLRYYHNECDLTVSLATGQVRADGDTMARDWLVHLVDTGASTQTGGRLARLRQRIGNEPFMMTYGDGVANVDLEALLAFHRSHGRIATVTAVHPVARFGEVSLDGDRVTGFREKPQTAEGWINGGFFVFEPTVFDYLEGDETVLEGRPLERLAAEGQLAAYKHRDFWQCMDTTRDRDRLRQLWDDGEAPWRVW